MGGTACANNVKILLFIKISEQQTYCIALSALFNAARFPAWHDSQDQSYRACCSLIFTNERHTITTSIL